MAVTVRDVWPVLLAAPLLSLPFIDWHFRHELIASQVAIAGRVVKVAEIPCLPPDGKYPENCWAVTIEYLDRERSPRRLIRDLRRPMVTPRIGDPWPLYLRPDGSAAMSNRFGSSSDWHSTTALAGLAVGALICAAAISVARVRRRADRAIPD